jgi:hypothetical protein
MSIAQSNFFSVSVVSSSGQPAWRASASLNTWYSIPNTRFIDSVQTPRLPSPYHLVGPGEIIDAWGGIGHSPVKRKLFVKGGGHSNYAGNDMYEFNFGADSPHWTQIKAYTPANQILADTRRYADGNPCSAHTYYDLHFCDQTDELTLLGPSAWYLTGGSGAAVAERFNYTTKTWRPVGECPDVTGSSRNGMGKAKHPNTEEIWFISIGGFAPLRKYNPVTTASTTIGNTNLSIDIYGVLCIDPIRNRILRGPYYGNNGGWATFSMTNGAGTVRTLTGDAISGAPASSVVWDSIGERFIHVNASHEITAIDPVTFVATRITVAGTAPTAAPNGFHGRTVFSAELKGLLTVPSSNQNVHFVKLYA